MKGNFRRVSTSTHSSRFSARGSLCRSKDRQQVFLSPHPPLPLLFLRCHLSQTLSLPLTLPYQQTLACKLIISYTISAMLSKLHQLFLSFSLSPTYLLPLICFHQHSLSLFCFLFFFTSLPSPLFSLLSLPPLFLSQTPHLSHPSLSRCGGSCCSCFHFPCSLVRGNQRFCCNSVYG